MGGKAALALDAPAAGLTAAGAAGGVVQASERKPQR
jgi:hypothetical protein